MEPAKKAAGAEKNWCKEGGGIRGGSLIQRLTSQKKTLNPIYGVREGVQEKEKRSQGG